MLWRFEPVLQNGLSSLDAIGVRLLTVDPVYTPTRVSKLLGHAFTSRKASTGSSTRHHSDVPPVLPAWSGSPGSLVAPAFEANATELESVRALASTKSSFAATAGVAGLAAVIEAVEPTTRATSAVAVQTRSCIHRSSHRHPPKRPRNHYAFRAPASTVCLQ